MKIMRFKATSAVTACLIATSVFAVNPVSASTPTPTKTTVTPTKTTVTPSSKKGKLSDKEGENRKDHKRAGCFDKMMGECLSNLVKEKVITSEQKNSIENAIKSAREDKKDLKGVFDDLVKAGTITQAQKDALIKEMMKSKCKHMEKHKNRDSDNSSTPKETPKTTPTQKGR